MNVPAPRPGDQCEGRPPFKAEIRAALRYEKVLAVRALAAIALVALVVVLRFYFFG
jgi:hypothetical protein